MLIFERILQFIHNLIVLYQTIGQQNSLALYSFVSQYGWYNSPRRLVMLNTCLVIGPKTEPCGTHDLDPTYSIEFTRCNLSDK